MRRSWLGLLLVGLMASASIAGDIDQQIAQEQQRLRKIQQESQFHQQKIKVDKQKKQGYLSELDQLDKQIKTTEQKGRQLDSQIKIVTLESQKLTDRIEERKGQVEELREKLRGRLVAMYKYGDVAEYNLLLSATDRVELTTVTYMLNRIAETDQKMMRELYTQVMDIAGDRKELQEKNKQLAGRRAELARNRQEHQKAVAARKDLIAQLDQNLSVHMAAIKEIEADQRALQATIDKLLAEKARAQVRPLKPGQKRPVEVVNKGGLIWPLDSRRITSPFGMRIHPKFKTKSMHTGIDIASPKGTPVKVAGSGTVLYAGWLRGYGQLIIVDHGKGISTVYAHLSSLGAREGQTVKQGQIIGRVGNTGVATGYHLHFEVRINGKAKNPMGYLPK